VLFWVSKPAMDYEPYDSSGELLSTKIKPFCVSVYGYLLIL
jgi:hypothetical protein